MRQAFNDGRLTHTRLADQHRIILGPPREHLHDPANFFIAPDHGIKLAAPRLLRQVARITLERLVLALRILVGDALRPSNRRQSLQDSVVGRTVTSEQLLRRIALQAGQPQQHVLGRHVFIFEGVRFFKRFLQKLVDLRRHGRLVRAAAARDLGQLFNFFVDIAEHGLRPNADFFKHGRNDALAVFDQRRQQMYRGQFRIAMLRGKLVCALDCFLRLNRKFVPTDGHESPVLILKFISTHCQLQIKRGRRQCCRLPRSLQYVWGRATRPSGQAKPGSCHYAALVTLFGSLLSSVFSPPTFTLICFGLASAFFASLTFNTPLS